MNAQVALLRQQLSQPINRLTDVDKVLADLEAEIPRRPGRWTNRSREAATITYQLCKNEFVAAITELDELCKAIDIAIE